MREVPKETYNSDKKKNNDAKSNWAAAFQPQWPERGWEEQAVIGLCRRTTCCVASSRSVSSFCQLYYSPEPCSCEPHLCLQESDGGWLQTQVTAGVTVSDYRKTAKSFFLCVSWIISCVSANCEVSQAPDVFFHFSICVAERMKREQFGSLWIP